MVYSSVPLWPASSSSFFLVSRRCFHVCCTANKLQSENSALPTTKTRCPARSNGARFVQIERRPPFAAIHLKDLATSFFLLLLWLQSGSNSFVKDGFQSFLCEGRALQVFRSSNFLCHLFRSWLSYHV